MMYKLNSFGLIGLSSPKFAFSGGKDYEDNAVLALAAPALLEALEAALFDIERLCERVDSEVGSLRDFDQIVEDGEAPDSYSKIIAAIAAAKGE